MFRVIARITIAILSASIGAGCSNGSNYLGPAESELGVDSDSLRIYHSAIFSPAEGLRAPGYVVGIERVPTYFANQRFSQARPPTTETDLHITHIMRYHVPLRYLHHVVQYPADTGGALGACVMYTMLDHPEVTHPKAEATSRCAGTLPSRCELPDEPAKDDQIIADFCGDLAETLRQGSFTHVMVMVMGWNTAQDEAMKNFNAIVGNMIDEAGKSNRTFRPLVIGVTWPSLWQLSDYSFIPVAFVRLASFPNISIRADWVHYSLSSIARYVLRAREKSGKNPNVVLFGHSFGARVVMEAINTKPDHDQTAKFEATDRAIMLSGAFEIQDIFADGDGAMLNEPFAGSKPRVTITASEYDWAVSKAFWGWYAGGTPSFNEMCRSDRDTWNYSDYRNPLSHRALYVGQIGCHVLDAEKDRSQMGLKLCASDHKSLPSVRELKKDQFRYFDASNMVNCNEPFTGGGAHSDIYRAETARFLLQELD